MITKELIINFSGYELKRMPLYKRKINISRKTINKMTKEQFEIFKANAEKNAAKERKIIDLCASVLQKGYDDSILSCLNQSYVFLKQIEQSVKDATLRFDVENRIENDNQ